MGFCACLSKIVKRYVKPLIYLLMNFSILCTDTLRGFSFLQGFDLCRCAILVCTTNVQHFPTPQTTVSGVSISRECGSDYIAQVRDVVHVRESSCYYHFARSLAKIMQYFDEVQTIGQRVQHKFS